MRRQCSDRNVLGVQCLDSSGMHQEKVWVFPTKQSNFCGENALLFSWSTEPTAPSCPLLFLKVGLQVLLFFFFGLRRQLGQTVGGQGERTTLLHTDSSAGSSRGLMYSNPSNSDWSILLMTSLRRRKREKMERMRRCCFVTNPGTQRHL